MTEVILYSDYFDGFLSSLLLWKKISLLYVIDKRLCLNNKELPVYSYLLSKYLFLMMIKYQPKNFKQL